MNSIRKWEVKNDATKKKALDHIMVQLDQIKDQEPGILFASELLQTIAETIGPDIYNMAIVDTKKVVSEKMADLDIDLDLLMQS